MLLETVTAIEVRGRGVDVTGVGAVRRERRSMRKVTEVRDDKERFN